MSKYRSDDPGTLATQFKALAHPDRLRMLVKLLACTTEGLPSRSFCCVGDLAREVDLAPSTVSHHLKELRQAGLIEVERRGRQIECRTGDGVLRRLAAFFGECCPQEKSEAVSVRSVRRQVSGDRSGFAEGLAEVPSAAERQRTVKRARCAPVEERKGTASARRTPRSVSRAGRVPAKKRGKPSRVRKATR